MLRPVAFASRLKCLSVLALTIALGALALCPGARATGGTPVGWGDDFYGQLGNGPIPAGGCVCVPAPTPVGGLSEVVQVSVGSYHSLALLADGTVMAWGTNRIAELGDGTLEDRLTPVRVPGLSNVVAVSAGSGSSLALLADGTVMAWGANGSGQLGLGTATGPEACEVEVCERRPTRIPGLSNVIGIDSGFFDAMALLADGSVRVWGENHLGEVGDGVGSQGGCSCVASPTAVPGVSGAFAISAGLYSNFALRGDGGVQGWGSSREGGLGAGGVEIPSPCECRGPVRVSLPPARAIAGGGHHGLAVLASGEAAAWGADEDGQLGFGAATPPIGCSCVLAPVLGDFAGAQSIAAGERHSLALFPDGSVTAWGNNEKGQLGLPVGDSHPTPAPIDLAAPASSVVARDKASFAILGPSQELRVSFAGAGAGTVGGAGVLCPPSCEGDYPQGQVAILRAEGRGGAAFAGFSGPCSGLQTCQVRMDRDQSLTATFGPASGTAILGARVSSRARSASFSFAAPGAITGYECELIRPPRRHRRRKAHRNARPHRRAKRATPRFSPCPSPMTYRRLTPGTYTFAVRALDILGPDASPATRRFTIRARRPRRPAARGRSKR